MVAGSAALAPLGKKKTARQLTTNEKQVRTRDRRVRCRDVALGCGGLVFDWRIGLNRGINADTIEIMPKERRGRRECVKRFRFIAGPGDCVSDVIGRPRFVFQESQMCASGRWRWPEHRK